MSRKYTPAPTKRARRAFEKRSRRPAKDGIGSGSAHGHAAHSKSIEKPRESLNKHHRWPRGHKNRNKDIVTVNRAQHDGFHKLFPGKTWHDPRLMEEILNTFIRPDYRVVIIKR